MTYPKEKISDCDSAKNDPLTIDPSCNSDTDAIKKTHENTY